MKAFSIGVDEVMNQQLTPIVAELEDAQERVHRLVAATPADRWSVRADPLRWSVAECIAHLNLTTKALLPLIRRALEEARRQKSPHTLRYRRDFPGWLLSIMAGPMLTVNGRRIGKVRTAAAFIPGGDLGRDTVVDEFDRLQTEQIGMIRVADGLPLSAVRIVSPFDARIRYNVYSALVILPRHQRRHLEQAEDVWSKP